MTKRKKMMTSPLQGFDRGDLHFSEQVLIHCSFLKEYGFAPVSIKQTLVRFESSSVFVNIYYGRSSYEIEAELGCLTDEDPISLSELIRFAAPQDTENIRPYATTTTTGIETGLSRLASHLQTYAQKVLRGDCRVFKQVRRARLEWSNEFLQKAQQSRIRTQAEDAFHQHAYEEVISAYESIFSDLTELELRKLEYAKNKLRQKRQKDNL